MLVKGGIKLFFQQNHLPSAGDSKSSCSLCQKTYTCVDRRMKLTTSELKNHLLLDHSSNPSVCAAYLLDEAQKMVNVTLRQCITKYAKATSKQECHMDHYIRGSYHDVNLNRALTLWLSCANLPFNVLDGGVFMNWCCTNNPWYRVACRPYIQCNFLDTGYAAAKNAFCIF